MTDRGLLIALEGGDGSGKSTQAKLLGDRLGAVITRQAGGTAFGQQLRAVILDPSSAHLSERAEALLFMADRAEHVAQLIEPALARGRHVVTDRYAYSSLAYQGYARGLDVEELREIADWSMNGLWPDITLLIEMPSADSEQRRVARGEEADHYEALGQDFQARVVAGYDALATADPDHWHRIDGTGSIDEVAERIWTVVQPLTHH